MASLQATVKAEAIRAVMKMAMSVRAEPEIRAGQEGWDSSVYITDPFQKLPTVSAVEWGLSGTAPD
jgi:hypothetical protein